MPIDLGAALAWEKASADEKRMLEDLQGNILKGHGREHTQNIFFHIDAKESAEGRNFIRSISGWVKSGYRQLDEAKKYRLYRQDAGAFVGLMLSASGYAALGIPDDQIPADEAFRSGLKKRQDLLNDPKVKAWDEGFQAEIHGMILIGGLDESQVRKTRRNILKIKPESVTILGVETGLAMKNKNGDGIEHFGYVDGRSQPLLLVEDINREATDNGGIDIWDPTFPLKQVLVPCPGGLLKELSFGSYFVFRKLEQNVKGFKDKEAAIADEFGLSGDEEELAGALIVGRFEDGTPVILQKTDKLIDPVPNNFDFSGDTQGNKCPFHSHIRKTNPRGDSVREFGATFGVTLEAERSHIMARRGITYGARNTKIDADGQIIELKDKPIGGVGLLFMAYQSDIANQFEFTQVSWANSPQFVKDDAGIDPVIGQGQNPTSQQQPVKWGEEAKKTIDFQGFVSMKGGEYFFAPSISFLKNL
ncbi:MAG: peroxidase [Chamaesiphon sp.]|nr:peroxidase [Chamaesiphon sp.]